MTRVIQGVGAIIWDADDRLLLVLRGHQPQAGRWSFPGGKVEPGETLEAATAREVLEETGLRIEVGARAWVVDIPGEHGEVYRVHDYVGSVCGGELCAGDDAADARWVPVADLTGLPLSDGLLEHLEHHGLMR